MQHATHASFGGLPLSRGWSTESSAGHTRASDPLPTACHALVEQQAGRRSASPKRAGNRSNTPEPLWIP